MLHNTNKALNILGKKYAKANKRGDIPRQKILLTKMANIGRAARVSGYPIGATRAAELHWNGEEPNTRQAHIEYVNGHKEQLIPNRCHGTKPQVEDADGDWICK